MPTGIYKHKPNQGFQKGVPFSKEHKRKIGKAKKGKPLSKEHKKNIGKSHKGKSSGALDKHWKLSEETRKKMSKAKKGDKNYSWKDGISQDKNHYNRQRRNRKLNAEGSHTFGEWELLKKQYGYTCPCCGKEEPDIKLTEDHIIPLSKGGSDHIENIQPLCRSCNSKKHTKIIKYDNI